MIHLLKTRQKGLTTVHNTPQVSVPINIKAVFSSNIHLSCAKQFGWSRSDCCFCYIPAANWSAGELNESGMQFVQELIKLTWKMLTVSSTFLMVAKNNPVVMGTQDLDSLSLPTAAGKPISSPSGKATICSYHHLSSAKISQRGLTEIGPGDVVDSNSGPKGELSTTLQGNQISCLYFDSVVPKITDNIRGCFL